MKKAIYPGTFDPPTLGHVDIAKRSLKICDELIIAIGKNSYKNSLFSLDERIILWKEIFMENPQVIVCSFDSLVVDFARKNGASFIIRGLRAISDFEYELQMASTNRSIGPDIDTLFFTAIESQLFVSSTIVKELASFGGDISTKAPPNVCRALEKKFSKNI